MNGKDVAFRAAPAHPHLDLRDTCVSPSGQQICVWTRSYMTMKAATYTGSYRPITERDFTFRTEAWVAGEIGGSYMIADPYIELFFAHFSLTNKTKLKAMEWHFYTVRALGEREYKPRRVR